MEYIVGVRLDEWSCRLQKREDTFAKRFRLAFTLTLSLSRAHSCRYLDEVGIETQGLIHGDLKPANVIVRADDSPIIVDFLIIDVQRLLDPKVVPPIFLDPILNQICSRVHIEPRDSWHLNRSVRELSRLRLMFMVSA
jgi:serine/threonine protein kinase